MRNAIGYALEVAREVVKNHTTLFQRIVSWQDAIYADKSPSRSVERQPDNDLVC